MARELIVAGLDLGTSRVKCVVAIQHPDGQVDVIGTGTHAAKGFQNGAVCNPEDAVRSIRAAVDEAEMMAGVEINEVFLSISGRHTESFNSPGMVRIQDEHVTEEDLRAVIDMARAIRMPPDKEVLHVIPQDFIIDGQPGVTRPLGMSGVRLEVSAHVVLGNATSTRAFEDVCRAAGLRVADIVLAPLAQAEALLTPQARDLGVVLVDIGGDTTDIAVFAGGAIVHSAVVPLGGEHVTLDIKDCLNTPTVEAEHLKQTCGCALAELVDADETVEIPGVGGRRPREIKRSLLCEIIEARVEEILKLVGEELAHVGLMDVLPGGIVLSGGTANLPGITELAERTLGMPAAYGEPKELHGLVDVVKNPRYATSTGLVLCAIREKHHHWYSTRIKKHKRRGFSRWFSFLPWVTTAAALATNLF